VRAAVYGLGLALLQTQPAVASAELGGLGGALLEGLSDKDPLCHAALWEPPLLTRTRTMTLTPARTLALALALTRWEPLLLLLRTHSAALREATPAARHILARLTSLLRHGCYGGALSAAHALLPLASLLPEDPLRPSNPNPNPNPNSIPNPNPPNPSPSPNPIPLPNPIPIPNPTLTRINFAPRRTMPSPPPPSCSRRSGRG